MRASLVIYEPNNSQLEESTTGWIDNLKEYTKNGGEEIVKVVKSME